METRRRAESRVIGLVEGILERVRTEALVAAVAIDGALLRPPSGTVSRAELAQALNLLLFDDLLRRVPAGALYVLDRVRRGEKVADVAALAEEELALGRPMKDRVEVSASGRVLQTAYRAARVERPFAGPGGALVLRSVPGSFFEFITRHRHADGRLDLGFDTSNAQAIFKMTAPVLA